MYSTANSSAGTKGQCSDDACPCTAHILWQVQRVMYSTNSSAGTKGQYSDDACPCTVQILRQVQRNNAIVMYVHRCTAHILWPLLPAPSSKLCQNWLRHWRGTDLYLPSPKGLGTNKTVEIDTASKHARKHEARPLREKEKKRVPSWFKRLWFYLC